MGSTLHPEKEIVEGEHAVARNDRCDGGGHGPERGRIDRHADLFHMVIGIAIGGTLWWWCFRREYGPNKYLPIELFGFYWHFVDIVWVFLFPMLYLISSPGGGVPRRPDGRPEAVLACRRRGAPPDRVTD